MVIGRCKHTHIIKWNYIGETQPNELKSNGIVEFSAAPLRRARLMSFVILLSVCIDCIISDLTRSKWWEQLASMRPCIPLVNYDCTHLLIALEPASAFKAHEYHMLNDLCDSSHEISHCEQNGQFFAYLRINFHLKINSCGIRGRARGTERNRGSWAQFWIILNNILQNNLKKRVSISLINI